MHPRTFIFVARRRFASMRADDLGSWSCAMDGHRTGKCECLMAILALGYGTGIYCLVSETGSAAAHNGATRRRLPAFTRIAESKHRDPRRPGDHDFHGLIDNREKANQLLQTEPLQTTSLEIRHSRLIDSKPSSGNVLIPTSDKRKYHLSQLFFENGDWVFLVNHAERSPSAGCRTIRNPSGVIISFFDVSRQ